MLDSERLLHVHLNAQNALLEPQVSQISGKLNTGLCQKLSTLTLADIRIENPLAPLARLKDTPLVQTQEPIEKQAQNFDPLNGQRGYINSKQHHLLRRQQNFQWQLMRFIENRNCSLA